jgi:putative ABC transport system permease protein
MHHLLSDIRFGVRTLLKSPGFTLVALATLALSLGANTAIFSFVNAVLLKAPPYDHPERIMRVLERRPDGGTNGISTLNFLDWQKENSVFEFLAARTGGSVSLTGIDEPVLIPGARVSAHYFDVFGMKAARGRTFLDGEDTDGRDHVVVLSHTLWQTQFGGAPDIVGRSIQLDGEPYEVVGVLPEGSPFERGFTKLWRPLTFAPANMTRNFHWFGAIGRLKPGVTVEQARAQMDVIGKRISDNYPDSNQGWGVAVDPFAEQIVNDDLRRWLYVLLSAVGMVLLIACANLANLTLMRVVGREREIAIRLAMGAGRWTLARQFLTESLILSFAGGLLGLWLGHATMKGLKAAMPPFTLPSEADVVMDGRVMLFSFALALLTGVLVGLFPALQAARPSLTQSLKQGGLGSSAGAHGRVRNALVVAEVAVAFMLLTGAGLLIRSLDRLSGVDPGFVSTNVLTFRLPISDKRFPEVSGLTAYLHQVTERIGALPGAADVALTTALPMQGWGYGMPFQIADKPTVDRSKRPGGYFKMVSPSYFRTLGMRLQKGRLLASTDVHGSPPVMVINDAMAKKYFSDQDPIGRRILVQEIVPGKTQLGEEIPWEIVGVVANEAVGGLDDKSENNPGMYVSNEQSPAFGQAVLIRSTQDTTLLREAVKKTIRQLSPDQTLPDMKTLDVIKDESLGGNRFGTMLLGCFAGVSLLLSAIGIYGVISYSVTQRTREIGIRAALGASGSDVMRLVLRHGMGLAILGLLLGVAGSFGLTQLMQSLLFGIGERDPVTLVTVFVVLSLVALVACLLPARRATRVDPVIALRSE